MERERKLNTLLAQAGVKTDTTTGALTTPLHFSTTVGLLLPIFFMFREIRKVVGLNPKNLLKRLLLSMILTIVMVILVLLVEYLLSFIFQPTNRMYSFIYVAAVGGVGMLVYIVLSLKVRLIDRFIGQRADSLRQRLRMK